MSISIGNHLCHNIECTEEDETMPKKALNDYKTIQKRQL